MVGPLPASPASLPSLPSAAALQPHWLSFFSKNHTKRPLPRGLCTHRSSSLVCPSPTPPLPAHCHLLSSNAPSSEAFPGSPSNHPHHDSLPHRPNYRSHVCTSVFHTFLICPFFWNVSSMSARVLPSLFTSLCFCIYCSMTNFP